MTTAEFERLVEGKNGPAVIKAVGNPHKIQKIGGDEYWYYDNVATDPITGKAASAQLVFLVDSTVRWTTINWH